MSQSPPSFFSLDTCHPLPRVCESLCFGCWLLAASFWMKGWADCAVACRLQDLYLDSRATCPMRKNGQVWQAARKEVNNCCLILMESSMRVSVTMWAAVIWFKLLRKRDGPWERGSEQRRGCVAVKLTEVNFYQIVSSGIQDKYCSFNVIMQFFYCQV